MVADISESGEKSVAASEPIIDEIVGKLIRAGYLNSDQRENPTAIAEAIDRMKRDLRGAGLGSGASDDDCAINDAAGKVTGDKELQVEGKLDKAKGAAHNAAGDAKDAVRDASKND